MVTNGDGGRFVSWVFICIITRIIKYVTLVVGLFFIGWRIAGKGNLIGYVRRLRCIVGGSR